MNFSFVRSFRCFPLCCLLLSFFLVGTLPAFSQPETSTQDKSPESADDFSFNPLKVTRDPFGPVKGQKNDDLNSGEIDEEKLCRKKLPLYDVNQLNLVGVLRGTKTNALILLPDGLTCLVEVGSKIGRRNGRVTRIKSNAVVILEEFTDFKNRVRPDSTTLVLAE